MEGVFVNLKGLLRGGQHGLICRFALKLIAAHVQPLDVVPAEPIAIRQSIEHVKGQIGIVVVALLRVGEFDHWRSLADFDWTNSGAILQYYLRISRSTMQSITVRAL